jgi:cyanate lyase
MKRILVVLFGSLLFSLSHAEERTAEQLVASKKKADMTYKQLMEIMGDASAMIHKGIIRENKLSCSGRSRKGKLVRGQ